MTTYKKIRATKIGKIFSTVIDGVSYTKEVTPKKFEQLTKLIKTYNKGNSQRSLDMIIELLTPVTVEAKKDEIKKAVAKKSLDKKIKKEEKKPNLIEKQANKDRVSVAKNIIAKTITIKQSKEEVKNLVVTREGLAYRGFEKIFMPPLLVTRINEFIDNNISIQPLLNFWLLCLANPNHIARTKLFDYLDKHKMMITPSGYFVTYRMVKTTDDPDKFTHAHNGTPRLYYKVGEVATLNRETECDEDGANDCSRGIHFGSPQFIGIHITEGPAEGQGYDKGERVITKTINNEGYGTNYSVPTTVKETQKFDDSYGNQATIWLVNPMHVVSVPFSDTRKLRACEGYFVKLTTAEEVVDMVQKDYLIFDSDYKKFELSEIKKMIDANKLKGYIENDNYAPGALTKLRNLLFKINITSGSKAQDTISKDLDLAQVKLIIKSRLNILV
jgi:hypothetical protein